MPNDNELARLAAMAAALRPDWNPRSVRHHLAAKHRDKAYADLAVALTVIAVDPTTMTPARLDEFGPWWIATRFNAGRGETPDIGPGRHEPRCQHPGHEHETAALCRLCRAETIAGTAPEAPGNDPSPAPDLRAIRDRKATA
jgi:hypothetical protein